MIKELLNGNLTLLLKSNRVVQDIEHYVKQCSFENVLKESIFLDKVGVVRSLNELRAVSTTTELLPASTNNALKVAKWLVEEKKANVNMCSDILKDTPWNSVVCHGNYKVAEYLISKGAAINGNDGAWLGSPLYEAAVSTLTFDVFLKILRMMKYISC